MSIIKIYSIKPYVGVIALLWQRKNPNKAAPLVLKQISALLETFIFLILFSFVATHLIFPELNFWRILLSTSIVCLTSVVVSVSFHHRTAASSGFRKNWIFYFLIVVSALMLCCVFYTFSQTPSNSLHQATKNSPVSEILIDSTLLIATEPEHNIKPAGVEEGSGLSKNNDADLLSVIQEFEIPEDIQSTIDVIASLVNADPVEDWPGFLDRYDSLFIQDPVIANAFLVKAIRANAPQNIVFNLLTRGATIDNNIASLIVTKKSLIEIKEFENYGLDVVKASNTGENLLLDSLLSKERGKVFDYLIYSGVAVQNANNNYLLDVLKRSEKLRLSPKYVSKMLSNGAEFSEKDRDWITDLKDKNPKYYTRLQEALNI